MANAGLRWQENFYEHRLRDANECEAFALYMFLNPYRAKLITLHQKWRGWKRWSDLRFRFEVAVTELNQVPTEWLREPTPAGGADL